MRSLHWLRPTSAWALALGLLVGCEAGPLLGGGGGPLWRLNLAPESQGAVADDLPKAPGVATPGGGGQAGPNAPPLPDLVPSPTASLSPTGGGGGGGATVLPSGATPPPLAPGMGGVRVAVPPLLAALEGSGYRLLAAQAERLDVALLQVGRPDRRHSLSGAALRSTPELLFDDVPPGAVTLRASAYGAGNAWLNEGQALGQVVSGQRLALALQVGPAPAVSERPGSGSVGTDLGFQEGPIPAGALLNAWPLSRCSGLVAVGQEGALMARPQVVEGQAAMSFELWGAAGHEHTLAVELGSSQVAPMAGGGGQLWLGRQVRVRQANLAPLLSPPRQAIAMAASSGAQLAWLTHGGELRALRPAQADLAASVATTTLAPGGNGAWWVGTASGVALRNASLGAPQSVGLGFAPTQLCEDGQGGLWALDGATERASHLDAQGQPLGQAEGVKALACSPDGQVWAIGANLRRLGADGSALATFPYAGDRLAVGSQRIWAHGNGVLRLIAR